MRMSKQYKRESALERLKRLANEDLQRRKAIALRGFGWKDVDYLPGQRRTSIKQITVNDQGLFIHAIVVMEEHGDVLWRSKNGGVTWQVLTYASALDSFINSGPA